MSFLYGSGRKSALCGGNTLSSCSRLGKGLLDRHDVPAPAQASPRRSGNGSGDGGGGSGGDGGGRDGGGGGESGGGSGGYSNGGGGEEEGGCSVVVFCCFFSC